MSKRRLSGSRPNSSQAHPNPPATLQPKHTEKDAGAPLEQRKVHPFIVFGVIFHLICIFLYTLPKPLPGVLDGSIPPQGTDTFLKYNHQVIREGPVLSGYLLTTGLWQYWDMFSPEPAQTDFYATAEVEFQDGTITTFNYPRVYEADLLEKYFIERYRKLYERINPDDNRYVWLPVAQAIGLKYAKDPKNPPVKVRLIRHFQFVVRHDAPNAANLPEPPYSHYQYYQHVIDQQELAQIMGWKNTSTPTLHKSLPLVVKVQPAQFLLLVDLISGPKRRPNGPVTPMEASSQGHPPKVGERG